MASPGQRIRNGRLEVTFLQTATTTGGALLEMEARYGARSQRPPAHFHPTQEERFRILEGTLHFVIDGRPHDAAAGEEVVLPPRAVHSIWNPGETPARVIWQARPALRTEDFLEATFTLAGDDQPMSSRARLLQRAAIASHFAAEIQLVPAGMRLALRALGLVARALGYQPRV